MFQDACLLSIYMFHYVERMFVFHYKDPAVIVERGAG